MKKLFIYFSEFLVRKNMLLIFVFLAFLTQHVRPYEKVIKIESNQVKIKYSFGKKEYIVDTHALSNIKPEDCSVNNTVCLKWADKAYIKINKINRHCELHELSESLSASFNLSNQSFYGGLEMMSQSWPIGKSNFNGAFVSNGENGESVLESYWIDSTGSYVYVNASVPLFVTLNETTLLLEAKNSSPYNRTGCNCTWMYRLCQFKNVLLAHLDAVANVFDKPQRVPDFHMISLPIWSTWAKYKSNISDNIVREFANSILHHKFSHSQIEIDDNWESCYGDMEVDYKKFPNMMKLVQDLKNQGFKTTLWIHPFVNRNCTKFKDAKKNGFFVQNSSGSVQTKWWNGNDSAYIDFTNNEAVSWWKNNLKILKKNTNVNSFKFDAGESNFTPGMPAFNRSDCENPETILKAYIKAIYDLNDTMVEVRVGRRTQKYGLFVRMFDRNTRWTGTGGLTTLIPELLHMNIIGYPFVLPDMIGGNGYDGDTLTEELFIRWLQVSVFMPVLQFSYPPWDFSNETIEIARKFVNLHGLFAAKIHYLMERAVKTGEPVNRPLWWIDPTDPICLTIDTEFLLGNDILVAPVLEEGARSRDIYLPKGYWKDECTKSPQIIEGPILLKSYPAGLDQLPYFSQIYSHTNGIVAIVPAAVLVYFVSILQLLYSCY